MNIAEGRIKGEFVSGINGNYLVTVSSKGKRNRLSTIDNDGADFGPDTPGTTSSGINEAINASQTGNVVLLDGRFRTRSKIEVKEGVNLSGNQRSVIVNDTEDPFEPVLWFKPYSSSSFLTIDANGQSGIKIGDMGNNDIEINRIKVYNTGNMVIDNERTQIAVEINGFNIVIHSIDVFQGNVGIKMAQSSDLRIVDLQVVNCSSGIVMSSSEHVNIEHFSVDSCSHVGLQIDSTNDLYAKGIVWNNTSAYPSNKLINGILLGNYSSDNPNNLITINAKLFNTGGTGIKLANTSLCNLFLDIANTRLNTKENEIRVGIEYSGGLSLINTMIQMDKVSNAIAGTVSGKLKINGNDCEP